MDATPGVLVVVRPSAQWRDRFRAYRIEVDGTGRGEVRPGGTLRVELEPGPHQVRAKIDWTGSPPIEVNIPGGSSVQLRVEPAGSNLQALAQLFRSDSYLRLIVDGSSP